MEPAKPNPEQIYTAENPDPDSNHEWYATFDPKSDEYHHGDTTKVPLGGQRVPETMPTPYKDGFDAEATLNEYDPSKDDEKCKVIEQGVVFLRELKKHLTSLNQAIINRGILIDKKREAEKKSEDMKEGAKNLPVIGAKTKTQLEETKKFIEEGQKNEYVDDLTDILKELWDEIDGLGTDTSKIKQMNIVNTKTTRGQFKFQTATMNRLKERKKEQNQQLKVNKENQNGQEVKEVKEVENKMTECKITE